MRKGKAIIQYKEDFSEYTIISLHIISSKACINYTPCLKKKNYPSTNEIIDSVLAIAQNNGYYIDNYNDFNAILHEIYWIDITKPGKMAVLPYTIDPHTTNPLTSL